MLEVSIKTTKEFCFVSKLVCNSGLVVRGHLAQLCMCIVTSKTNFMFFKQQSVFFLHSGVSIEYVTAPVSLSESVFM